MSVGVVTSPGAEVLRAAVVQFCQALQKHMGMPVVCHEVRVHLVTTLRKH